MMTHEEWLSAKTAGERDRDEMIKRFAEVIKPWLQEVQEAQLCCTCPRFSDGIKVFPQRQCEWCKESGQ